MWSGDGGGNFRAARPQDPTPTPPPHFPPLLPPPQMPGSFAKVQETDSSQRLQGSFAGVQGSARE